MKKKNRMQLSVVESMMGKAGRATSTPQISRFQAGNKLGINEPHDIQETRTLQVERS